MSNFSPDDEESRDLRKKQKKRFSKENHSEIERRRRLTMNHYISQLADLFSRGEFARKKLNKINVLKYAASYMKRLQEKEKTHSSQTSLSFLTSDEIKIMTLDSLCGFEIKIDCKKGKILDVSEYVDCVLGCKKESLIGSSIHSIVYKDDLPKIEEQLNLYSLESFQIFDFKRGLIEVESSSKGDLIKNRKFYLRLKCFNDKSVIKEYFCPNNKYTYKYHNFKSATNCRLKYDSNEYILLEFTGLFKISEREKLPYLHLIAYLVEDSKFLNEDLTSHQISVQLSLDGIITHYEQNGNLFSGFEENQILHYPFSLFVHSDDQSLFHEIFVMSKLQKEPILCFMKLKIMNKNGTYTIFKIHLKCIRSVFSGTAEFFNLFLEKDIPIINPEIVSEQADDVSLTGGSNSNLGDPSLSPVIIKNFSPRLSPIPSCSFLAPNDYYQNENKKFKQEIQNLTQSYSVPSEFSSNYQILTHAILPLNYVQTAEPIPSYQMVYPQQNYEQYSYKNNFQPIANDGFDQVAMNTGVYTNQYTEYPYIPSLPNTNQTYFIRNSQQHLCHPQNIIRDPNIQNPQ